jgi:hypothetical protein
MKNRPDDKPAAPNEDRMEAFQKKMAALIEKHGFTTIATAIDHEGELIPLAYTVGLADAGLPEIFAFGLPPEAVQQLLNVAANQLKAGQLPLDAPVEKIATLPLVFTHKSEI